MRDWYGPAIAVGGVPGNVWAQPGGDFTGVLRAGYEATIMDRATDLYSRLKRGYRRSCRPNGQLNAGFSSMSDLINEVTVNAKRQELAFIKVGTTGVLAVTNSLFKCGTHPVAGSNASSAPAGNAPTVATAGALIFSNPTAGDTTHITTGWPLASVINSTLLLYDRIFHVLKLMNSTATEAVTGVPTRYQSSTVTDADYIAGNFLFPEVSTALAATAHNWTVCTYTDQGGSASNLPSVVGNSAAIINRLDIPAGQWFMPLASGDVGVKALTQMQCDALVATGAIDFVIGHPLLWMPCTIANVMCAVDGINSAFGFARIFDSACLAMLEICKPATTATTYTGTVALAAG